MSLEVRAWRGRSLARSGPWTEANVHPAECAFFPLSHTVGDHKLRTVAGKGMNLFVTLLQS